MIARIQTSTQEEAEKLQKHYHSLCGMVGPTSGKHLAFAGRNATPAGNWDYFLMIDGTEQEFTDIMEKFLLLYGRACEPLPKDNQSSVEANA